MEERDCSYYNFLIILDSNLKYQSLSLLLNLKESQRYSGKIYVLYVFESGYDKDEYGRLVTKLLEFSAENLEQDSLDVEVIYVSNQESQVLTSDFILSENTKITSTTFLRLSLSKWLPRNLTQVLYLDIDILVKSCLKSLFDREYDSVLCAVKGGSYELSFGKHLDHFNSIYFNAGVLLINMKEWLAFNVESEAHAIGRGKKYPLMDQDILNLALKDKWHELEMKYNFQQMFDTTVQLRANIQSPIIIHYVGVKPWAESRSTLYVNEYRHQFNKIRKIYPELIDKGES
jgi:lipopolysaccharide biosynthesis glycosyltransferase